MKSSAARARRIGRLRFASLGSGSRGNATVIQAGRTTILLDCGFSVTEAERRLARLDIAPDSLTALLVTHEHSDHVSGAARLARRYGLAIWATAGTLAACDDLGRGQCRLIALHQTFAIDDLEVQPVTVPHDAREPSQFVFGNGARRLGVLTDTGRITAHIQTALSGCDALMLECNHDAAMLTNGPYPPALKARVGGKLGHLSNGQAASLLETIDTGGLQHLVAAHLSERNNTPGLAREALAAALNAEAGWVEVAGQAEGLGWREVV